MAFCRKGEWKRRAVVRVDTPGTFSAGEPQTSETGLQRQWIDTDGPEAPEGLMRSDAVTDRHAVVISDAAPVADDDVNDNDMQTTLLENGDSDEEDTMFPLPGDDDGDPICRYHLDGRRRRWEG